MIQSRACPFLQHLFLWWDMLSNSSSSSKFMAYAYAHTHTHKRPCANEEQAVSGKSTNQDPGPLNCCELNSPLPSLCLHFLLENLAHCLVALGPAMPSPIVPGNTPSLLFQAPELLRPDASLSFLYLSLSSSTLPATVLIIQAHS